jgi:5'-nucleotidase
MTLLRSIVVLACVALAGAGRPAPQIAHAQSAPSTYRILLTNDDGVRAPGIAAVAEALKTVGEVTIVAPAENQSGKGHSISITDPVYVDEVVLPSGLKAFGATATPASCVKVALLALLQERPDLVVSGINRGINVGRVTYVSGTVGAAREATLHGLPAIASSLDTSTGFSDYTAAAKATAEIAAMVKIHGLPEGVFLNVNVPAGVPKGIRLSTQSRLTGEERWVEHKNPRGRRYFWNDYEEPKKDEDPATDVSALADGYVAVVPLHAMEYDAAAAEKLKAWIR